MHNSIIIFNMPQVDFNTYTTTIFVISNSFIFGYILLNIYFLQPLLNSHKVVKKMKVKVNVRAFSSRAYLNLFNLFLSTVK